MFDYFRRNSWEIVWRRANGQQVFSTTQLHRPLSDYVNALGENGLYVSRMVEPRPGGDNVPMRFMRLLRIPQTVVIEVTKVPR